VAADVRRLILKVRSAKCGVARLAAEHPPHMKVLVPGKFALRAASLGLRSGCVALDETFVGHRMGSLALRGAIVGLRLG
jgi:hypothetical protein